MRSNCDIFIYLNVEKMLAGKFFFQFLSLDSVGRLISFKSIFYCFIDSVPLFTSSNNVVLTSGVEGGILPAKYFKKVVRKSGEVLSES